MSLQRLCNQRSSLKKCTLHPPTLSSISFSLKFPSHYLLRGILYLYCIFRTLQTPSFHLRVFHTHGIGLNLVTYHVTSYLSVCSREHRHHLLVAGDLQSITGNPSGRACERLDVMLYKSICLVHLLSSCLRALCKPSMNS